MLSSTLVERARNLARTDGRRQAYVFLEDGERRESTLDYATLDLRARAFAAAIQARVGLGERVLLLLPSGLDFVASFLGCLYAGAIAVPVYPPKLNRSLERVRSIARDCRPSAVVVGRALLEQRERVLELAPELVEMRWIVAEDATDQLAAAWREHAPRPDDVAFLQYTSGSTGSPRGVMVNHGNLIHNGELMRVGFANERDGVIVSWLPLHHDMGLIGMALQTLHVGCSCVLFSPANFLVRPTRWLEAIARYRGTTTGGPNFAFELAARRVTPAELAALDLSSLRTCFNGSEPVRKATMELFERTFAPCGLRRDALAPGYGLAEATLYVASEPVDRPPRYASVSTGALALGRVEPPRDSTDAKPLALCGEPLAGMSVAIVDPATRGRCASDRLGEIWLASASVARGYWNQPEVSERTFGARIEGEPGAWLRTGDLGALRDGALCIAGRLKDVILLRGQNHYPQDLEATVERAHEDLRAAGAAAFGVEIDGEERLVVVQELERRRGFDAEGILAAIRGALAERHEVAVDAIVLTSPGGVPKTSSGKVQRGAARAQWLAGELDVLAQWRAAPDVGATPPCAAEAAARGERTAASLERWLVELAAQRIGVEPASIDRGATFAELGLDSLRMLSIAHEVERALGIAFPLARFFDGSSIRTIAASIAASAREAAAPRRVEPRELESSSDTLPLSSGQRALWFLHRLDPTSSAYNAAVAVELDARLDPEALRRALELLIARHELLRTTFGESVDGEPFQRVHPRLDARVVARDASRWSARELADELARFAHEPHALEHESPMRLGWFELAERGGVLVLAAHHIAVDQASLTTLYGELSALYRAELEGARATLPPPPAPFAEFVRDANRGVDAGALEFWRAKLRDAVPLEIAPDRARQDAASRRCGTLRAELDPTTASRLRDLARELRTTPFVVTLAAFECVLHRWSGERSFTLGTLTAGRASARFASTVGYFVDPLVLAASFERDPTALEIVERARDDVARSIANQRLAFADLVERLAPPREPGRTPFFSVLFAWQHTVETAAGELTALALSHDGAQLSFGGLSARSRAIDAGAAQFDLALTVGELRAMQRFALALEYDAELYAPATAARLLDHVQRLLGDLVRRPSVPVRELELAAPAEIAAELDLARGERVPVAERFVELFAARVAAAPESIAIEGMGARWSYAELDRRARAVARRLRELGVGAESLVAVHVARSPERVVALLAAGFAGGAWMPLDPDLPDARVALLIARSRPRVVLTSGRVERFAALGVTTVDVEVSGDLADSRDLERASPPPSSAAYVIYTSGSTGEPKGVVISHRSLANHATTFARTYSYRPGDRVAQIAAVGFDQSVEEIFPPLAVGATLIFGTREQRADLLAWVREARITVLDLVTGFWHAWVESLPGRVELPAHLRRIGVGGEQASPRVLARWIELAGDRVAWINTYGPTETSVVSATWSRAAGAVDATIPIGRAEANQSCYVIDADGRPQALGLVGELAIGGVGVARGYLGDRLRTAASFVPDPFAGEPGARMYLTGDRALRRASGELVYLGRADDQVKVRGHRVEPREIEEALRAHSSVAAAAVVAQRHGAGHELAAFVVAREGALDVAALKAFLGLRLPLYLVPTRWSRCDRLPLNAHGKLDRAALRGLAIAADGESVGDAPQGDAERALARVWSDVLGLREVARDGDFFALGGDSIRSLQVVARAAREGWRVRPDQVFRHPTLRELAAVAVRETRPSKPRATAALRDDERQRVAALLERIDGGDAAP